MKRNALPLFITVKDVQRITGLSYSASKKRLKDVRRQLNKPNRSQVLRREYCMVMGFTDEDLLPYYL